MTPYNTPHTSATPRYGQQTPLQGSTSNGTFVHPAAVSSSRGNYHSSSQPQQSPYGHSASRPHPSPHTATASPYNRNYVSVEENWDEEEEAWPPPRATSKSREGSITPRDARGTPHNAQRTPRYDDHARKTPQYDANSRHMSRNSRDYHSSKSPRSVRSTPRTNTSPHSMMLGDSTPLYDEN